ncbi:MAG: DUF2190 family protein [Neptunomonas phycophila]|uniref:capsid cement protein n=1 Tax=Neptunomonas phycophila TaxID=1572645 RepID=UPI003B8BC111
MKLSFRQGIVRHQKDPQGTQQFLLEQSDSIDLIAVNDPTTITFAHKNRNYVFTEKRSVPSAWTGPFAKDGTDYWLFWDLDVVTGIRTFGHTTLEPIVGPTQPTSAAVDQHWFDTSTNTMKVFNGASFKERLRVFAAKYTDGTVITAFNGGTVFEGSQVGLIQSADGGALIFDDADRPLRRGDGTFITTADNLASGLPNASNIKIEALQFTARASTNIAAYHIVYLNDFDSILPATPLQLHNVPFGIIEEDAYTGEPVAVTTDGVICNPHWNWGRAGAELYIDQAGMITDNLQAGMLPIGYVLSQSEILLKTSGVTQVSLEGSMGAENLPDLGDVTITGVGDGEVMVYSGAQSQWINVPLPTGPNTLEGLFDTQVEELDSGHTLEFQPEVNAWVNVPPKMTYSRLSRLLDTDVEEASDGNFLQFNEEINGWIASDITVSLAVNDLTDTMITSPTYAEFLRYRPGIDGMPGHWINSPIELTTLDDTNVAAAQVGDVLSYVAPGEWKAVPATGVNMFHELADTMVTEPTEGQILRFDPANGWINEDFNFRVAITGFPSANDILQYNDDEGAWVNTSVNIPATANDLTDVTISNPQDGDTLTYVPGVDLMPGTWVNTTKKAETVLTRYDNMGGGVTPVIASKQWNTINCTQDTQLSFDFNGISPTDVVEFTLEIYPGTHAITWPAGIIGDTTLEASKMNVFTIVRRPSMSGLSERIYCMKVAIANDNVDPLLGV